MFQFLCRFAFYQLSLCFVSNSVQHGSVSGHGLVIETLLGRVEVKNSRFVNNFGNGIKVKFMDGRFPIVDELLTFCRVASLDNQKFPQLIVGVPGPFRECFRVRLVIFYSPKCFCCIYLLFQKRNSVVIRVSVWILRFFSLVLSS